MLREQGLLRQLSVILKFGAAEKELRYHAVTVVNRVLTLERAANRPDSLQEFARHGLVDGLVAIADNCHEWYGGWASRSFFLVSN